MQVVVVGDRLLREGDWLSLNGSTGEVILGTIVSKINTTKDTLSNKYPTQYMLNKKLNIYSKISKCKSTQETRGFLVDEFTKSRVSLNPFLSQEPV
jgi:hypothetical protein